MTVRIWPMQKKDKPALMKILQNTPEFKPFEVVVAEELVDSYLQSPLQSGYYVLIAGTDSGISGYICYGQAPLTEGTWDIYWMAVAPEKQGQGIGGALIASAEAQIEKAQGRLVIIETSSKPDYEKTRRFHSRQGYEMVCQLADFYAPGDDKVILQKRLDQRRLKK